MTYQKTKESRFTEKTVVIPKGIEFVSAEINLLKKNNIWKNDMLDYQDETGSIKIEIIGDKKKHVAIETDRFVVTPDELMDLTKFAMSLSELTGKY